MLQEGCVAFAGNIQMIALTVVQTCEGIYNLEAGSLWLRQYRNGALLALSVKNEKQKQTQNSQLPGPTQGRFLKNEMQFTLHNRNPGLVPCIEISGRHRQIGPGLKNVLGIIGTQQGVIGKQLRLTVHQKVACSPSNPHIVRLPHVINAQNGGMETVVALKVMNTPGPGIPIRPG